jgi:prepilin peptidase CpaA
MNWNPLFIFAPLLAMLVCAAATDLHSRRIPNVLTLLIALTGLLQSFTPVATISPWQSIAGLLVGLALTIALFALGALGGGDVKLLAAAGAWIGPLAIFQVFLAAAIVGMLIVLTQCLLQGRLQTLLRNSLLLIVNLVHLRQLGLEHTQATGQSCRSVDKPLPYAVPVLIATITVLLLGGLLA